MQLLALGGEEKKNNIIVDVAGVAITYNSDGAGYYGAVPLSDLPQGKVPYAAVWEGTGSQAGVTFVLSPNSLCLCSPVALTIPASAYRKVKIFYM